MQTIQSVRTGRFSQWLAVLLIYSMVFLPLGPGRAFAATSHAAVSLDEGIRLYEAGAYEKSRSTLAEASLKEPDNPAIHLYLGLAQMRLGNSTNAIAGFERFIALAPDSPEAPGVRQNITLLKRSHTKEEVKSLLSGERQMFAGPDAAKIIAVYTPVNLGDSRYSGLGRGLAAMIIHDLLQLEQFTVVERIRMQALLDELALSGTELTSKGMELRTGQLLGAGKVIPGSYSVGENVIAINTSLLRTDIGYTIGRQMASGRLEQFWELEKMLVFSILKDLGVDKKDILPHILPRVSKVQTKSLAAFTAYSAGIVASDKEDYAEARKQFQKALKEDNDFELAALALIALPLAALGVVAIMASLESSAGAAAGATKIFAAGAASSGTATSSGTAASSGAAASSGSAGLSTGTWIAIGAGAVAVTAGTAMALSGGGGGSSQDDEITTVEGTWDFHLRCAGESSDASVITLVLNESTGGSYSGSGSGIDYDGTQMGHTLTGFYNSSNHQMTGELTSTFTEGSCVRIDNFNTVLDSSDSGYFFMTQSQPCGCDAEGRLVKR